MSEKAAKIAIIDYGVGNLRSVQKAFAARAHEAVITEDAGIIEAATHVVLPGVGAFGAAAEQLRARGLEPVARRAAESGKPFLGICVGMQLLLTESEEMGQHEGLNLIPGRVLKFDVKNLGEAACGVKVPQIGWNSLHLRQPTCPLLAGVTDGDMVYFVHSYYCAPDSADVRAAETDYIAPYCSVVWRDNLYGAQFHPEKSGKVGLTLLDNFARLAPTGGNARA